ncbi:MAG: FecR family protein [Spirochaetes bacterium]|nr:FecR family protein [Spirochaetota bacterium]
MFRKTLVFMIILILGAPLMAAKDQENSYGKIDFIIGSVQVKQTAGTKVKANLNMKVYTGDTITTGDKSSAQLVLKGDIKIRIAQNSEFELKQDKIEKSGKKKKLFGLNFGKIWASIKNLKKDEEVSIETPTAVAGVRGTILVVKQDDKGAVLYVGKGKVNFLSKLLGTDVDIDENFKVFIGNDGKISVSTEMGPDDHKDMMGGIPVFFQKGDAGTGDDLKFDLKSEVEDEKNNLLKEKQFAGKLKSEDLSAGRTLKDIHGNLVRVEQIFRKKDKQSIQLLNITLRDDGLAYFDLVMKYNLALPDSFKDWFSFFEKNDDVKLQERNAEFGTKRVTKVNDTFQWNGTYNSTTDELDDKFFINGTEYYGDMDDINTVAEGKSELYTLGDLTLYSDPAKTTVAGTVRIGMYIINNDGKILSEKHFSSDSDILNIFNTTAGEIIIQSSDLLNGDIDVVTIPDIAFVLIQEIL